MSVARARIYWRFDGTSEATVEIDRSAQLFSVRPLRRRRAYVYPLSVVAQIVCERIIKAEAAEKRAARKNRK